MNSRIPFNNKYQNKTWKSIKHWFNPNNEWIDILYIYIYEWYILDSIYLSHIFLNKFIFYSEREGEMS